MAVFLQEMDNFLQLPSGMSFLNKNGRKKITNNQILFALNQMSFPLGWTTRTAFTLPITSFTLMVFLAKS